METGFARLERDIGMIVGVAAVVGKAVGESARTAVAVGMAARKWSNYKPPRHMLLPCPKGDEAQKQWERLGHGCGIVDALKFGAMLLNVTQHVDSSPIYGKGKHIVARNPGVKGWLKDNCRGINYVTAMSYRKLAETTCRAIKLPEYIPLEWVLPGTEREDEKRELNPEGKTIAKLKRKEFLRQIRECRGRLCKLLDGVRSVNQLYGNLDKITNEHRQRVCSSLSGGYKNTSQKVAAYLRVAQTASKLLNPGESVENLDELIAISSDLTSRLRALRA